MSFNLTTKGTKENKRLINFYNFAVNNVRAEKSHSKIGTFIEIKKSTMKKILFLLFVFFIAISFSQEIDIKKSAEFEDEMIKTRLLFSENDGNDGLIIVRNTETVFTFNPYPKEYYIEHYDKDLNLIKKIILPNGKTSLLKGIIVKNNIINLIEFDYTKKQSSLTINVLQSDIDNLDFKTKEIYRFGENEFEKYFGEFGLKYIKKEFKFIDKNPFGFIDFSKNKKYFDIRFFYDKKENKSQYFIVFNNEFEKVYESKFEKNNKFFDFKHININDNNGTIYLLSKVFENNSRKTKKNDKTNYHYELFNINSNGIKQKNLKEDNKFISSLFITSNKENVFLVGFYSGKNDNYIKGVCRYNLNTNDLEVKSKHFNSLNEQFYTDKYKNGLKGKSKGIKYLDLKSLFLDEQENIVINTEEFTIENPNFDFKNIYYNHFERIFRYNPLKEKKVKPTKKSVYHFDDIISIKIDNNGKVIWSRNIQKKQTGFFNSSYTSTYINNKAYFYFNGTLKTLKDGRFGFLQTSSRNSNLFVVEISNDELKYKKIIDNKNSEFWYSVNNGIVSKDFKSVSFQGTKKRKKKVVKLTIE